MPVWEDKAKEYAFSGRRIEAIKLVRQSLGVDLRPALDIVKAWVEDRAAKIGNKK